MVLRTLPGPTPRRCGHSGTPLGAEHSVLPGPAPSRRLCRSFARSAGKPDAQEFDSGGARADAPQPPVYSYTMAGPRRRRSYP